MIILDILFKICFAPFQKVKNGRSAAIIWLIQILGFTLLGIVNALLFMIGINLPSMGIAILGAISGASVYFLFDKIYVKNGREVGKIRSPFLMGVLIFISLMASIVFMIFSLARY